MMAQIRTFFQKRGVLEVDTPLMGKTNSPCRAIEPYVIDTAHGPLFLQTSPEFFLKRLLGAGLGDCYQLGKVFRQEECGRYHNDEFTMLEWYRRGWSLDALVDETQDLLIELLACKAATRTTYRELFIKHLGLCPHQSSEQELRAKLQIDLELDHQGLCDYAMTHVIEPSLQGLWVVRDFPITQASYAKTRQVDGIEVANRFECYFNGVELANGYDEINGYDEQSKRLDEEIQERRAHNARFIPKDENLCEAVQHIPDCAGVALGVDRVIMLALNASHLSQVIPFSFDKL